MRVLLIIFILPVFSTPYAAHFSWLSHNATKSFTSHSRSVTPAAIARDVRSDAAVTILNSPLPIPALDGFRLVYSILSTTLSFLRRRREIGSAQSRRYH